MYRVLATLLCLLSTISLVVADDPLSQYRDAAIEKWSGDMDRIAKLDKSQQDPPEAVLFLGSSSIRLWKEIADDLKPWPVIERGFGGSKFSDVAVFADQLIKPHKFRAVAIFVGNDVTGKPDDKTPEEVVRLFEHVVAVVRKYAPQAPVFLIEITPTPKRWAAWPKIQEVNAALKKACEKGEHLHFISTHQRYLDSNGQPMPELFREDLLHQNRDGYQRWSQLIRDEFAKVIPVTPGK